MASVRYVDVLQTWTFQPVLYSYVSILWVGTKQTFVPMCLPGWLQLSARGLHNTGSHASTNERCVGPCQTYIILMC